MKELLIHTDGGARGNPGPAAAGAYIENLAEKVRLMCGKYLGANTNNFAEYQGVILGLKVARKLTAEQSSDYKLSFYLDSSLIVNQLNGNFKLKAENLLKLFETVKEMEKAFGQISYTHVPREENKFADQAVNKALDRRADFQEEM